MLIPYLNKGNYFGVEPNKWLVDDGVKNEIGQDMVSIKQPSFSYANTLGDFVTKLDLDYVFAQSIFSHCGKDIVEGWFGEVSKHICEKGMFLITFKAGNRDCGRLGWVYPGCVPYKLESMEQMANRAGFSFTTLNWYHPRQTWALLTKNAMDFLLNEVLIFGLYIINYFYKFYNQCPGNVPDCFSLHNSHHWGLSGVQPT